MVALSPQSSVLQRSCALMFAFAFATSLAAPIAIGQSIQDGDVIVVSEVVDNDNALRVYDGCTGALKRTYNDPRWVSTGNGRYVNVAPDGMIWVGDRYSNRIFRYDRNLNPTPTPSPGGYVVVPCGNGQAFSFNATGRLYVTTDGSPVVSFDPMTSDSTPACVGSPCSPWGLDTMPNGLVCISLYNSPGGINIVDPQTGAVVKHVACVGQCWDLDAIQSGGLIIANEYSANQVVAIDPAQPPGSECLWSIPLNGGGYPNAAGLSVNEPLGLIYVAVYRGGEYWLESYDLSAATPHTPRLSVRMDPNGWFAGAPPSTLVVVPGGNCSPITPFCFGDGSIPTRCPCVPPNIVPTPSGAPGHGCANSFSVAGALLSATGATAPDSVQFICAIAPNYSAFGFLVKGNASSPNGVQLSDGIMCISGSLVRFAGHNAGTNGAPLGSWTYPNTTQTIPVSIVTAQGSAQHAYYQLYYRNAAPGFCTPALANLSNGIDILWP